MSNVAPQIDRLVPPHEALSIILGNTPRLGTERVALAAAFERVLAESITADEDMPPFPAATMDGFAVVSSDTTLQRRLVGEQLAGYVAGLTVSPGTAARITTGSPLPPGADAVIQLELVDELNDQIILREAVSAGNNIRPIAADLRRGDSVLTPGVGLGPAEVGLLAGLGRTSVEVYRRPRVAVLSTGDELVDPAEPPAPGQIRDSNRFSLMAAVARCQAEVVTSGMVRDAQIELRQMMRDGLEKADVLITSGGVSMGKLDLVKGLIDELGHLHLRRLFVKPGKPFHFATVPGVTAAGSPDTAAIDRLIFGLPGNPVSSLVAFELLIRPALLTMQGLTNWRRPHLMVRLAHDIRAAEDRIEYQRGIVEFVDGQVLARNTGPQHSARLASLVGANALLILPPRASLYRAGEAIEAMLI